MELSLLLAEQILAMFLIMAVGFFIVKIGLFQESDGKVLSNLVVYICSPCVIVDSFQIEMTDDKIKGLLLAVIAAIFVHIVMLAGTWILNHIFHFNSIEKASIIYTNAGYLIICPKPLTQDAITSGSCTRNRKSSNPKSIATILGLNRIFFQSFCLLSLIKHIQCVHIRTV